MGDAWRNALLRRERSTMITRSRVGGASNMEASGDQGTVPLSMIPLLEVAYSKCQEEEKDGLEQRSSWNTKREPEGGKKRKRSSNWSEAETIQLLLLRKAQLQNKEERRACPKGSSAWDEIASQLKDKFIPRSGKHVGERWDTLRRVYTDIEEHCSEHQKTYAEVLDANRELFKFIPTEYTQKWHELIADCKPGKRRGKKTTEAVSSQKDLTSSLFTEAAPLKTGPVIEEYPMTSHKPSDESGSQGDVNLLKLDRAAADAAHIEYRPSESSPTLRAQSSQIASAFDTLIKDIEHIFSRQRYQHNSSQRCERTYARRTRDCDERVDGNGVERMNDMCYSSKMNVVASLQSVLEALKSASEFTSSDSYLLKIDKREWNIVEHNMRAFSDRHKNNAQPRPRPEEKTNNSCARNEL